MRVRVFVYGIDAREMSKGVYTFTCGVLTKARLYVKISVTCTTRGNILATVLSACCDFLFLFLDMFWLLFGQHLHRYIYIYIHRLETENEQLYKTATLLKVHCPLEVMNTSLLFSSSVCLKR